jgi:transcriptional regulator with AAA-type ATPase domain/transcriptional regulatory protein LevR
MELVEMILQEIQKEDRKEPYQDQQLAELLACDRTSITKARKRHGIEESRTRFKQYVAEEIAGILQEHSDLPNRELIRKLGKKGFSISPYMMKQIRFSMTEPKLKNSELGNKKQIVANKAELESVYSDIVGNLGSFKTVIQSLEAAVMYPPKGLNTLITGESGVGKTMLARKMYDFGRMKGRFPLNSEFVHFNCADYAENSQLILSMLFGVKKGAYTGASDDRLGLVEKARNSILFLDEVHRMPPEGQEILFKIIDEGVYRRLGESDREREINVFIVAATTEEPTECLLDTFLRRFPMMVHIPPLKQRPASERLELIERYLLVQAKQLQKDIWLDHDSALAFLLHMPKGNVGKLFNEIQVCIAKAYLESMIENKKEIRITFDLLDHQIQRNLMDKNQFYKEANQIVHYQGLTIPKDGRLEASLFNLKDEETIYKLTEHLFQESKELERSIEETQQYIGEKIEGFIQKKVNKTYPIDKQNIIKIIGTQLASTVERALELAAPIIQKYDMQLFYSLAVHINETIERVKAGKAIENPKLRTIETKHNDVFRIALRMTEYITSRTGVEFPKDEAAFVAMYLLGYIEKEKDTGRIGILVLNHGEYGLPMIRLAEKLMGEANIANVAMKMEDQPSKVLPLAMERVREMDEGKGVLLFVDMGSLNAFGSLIEESTGIKVKTIARFDVLMLMEAVRMCRMAETSLGDIHKHLIAPERSHLRRDDKRAKAAMKKPLIITTCMTGQGASVYLKELLDRSLDDLPIEIKEIGVFSEVSLDDQIQQLSQTYTILCAVGTINPKKEWIPFISIEQVVSGKAVETIRYLYRKQYGEKESHPIDRQLVFNQHAVSTKEECIEFLCRQMVDQGFVTEGYLQDVYEREAMGLTCLLDAQEKGIAIIHTVSSKEVIRDGMSILSTRKPIFWDAIDIDVVVVMALTDSESQLPYLVNRTIFQNEDRMRRIRASQSKDEMFTLIQEALQT